MFLPINEETVSDYFLRYLDGIRAAHIIPGFNCYGSETEADSRDEAASLVSLLISQHHRRG